MAKWIKLTTRGSKQKDKQPDYSHPSLEKDMFQALFKYQNYQQMIPRKVEPLKFVRDKTRVTTHLPHLLKKYKLIKFLYSKSNAYLRLVRIFYANLGVVDDKLSCYVMHRHVIIDFDVLAKDSEMDATLPKLAPGDFPDFTKDKAIDMLFPFQSHRDSSKKFMITRLSPKDRILHFILCKVLFPRVTNFTQITDDELFYMWAIKTQANFNFPYMILH